MKQCEENHVIYKAKLEYPLFFVPMPRFLHADLVKLFFRITQIPHVYQAEHGECPSKFASPDESRCSLAGEWSNIDALLFSHQRYVVGQLVGIENGTH